MLKGKLIVIDGMDGSGKGTQIKKVRGAFPEFIFTREPGGTPKAEEIRRIILDGKNPSTPFADFLLFWASRVLHIEQVITPALESGASVISDRFDSSTYAFQICGEEHPELLGEFLHFRSLVLARALPSLYIFLDLPSEVAFERRQKDVEQEKSKFDIEPVEYHERVRQGFLSFPPQNAVSSRVCIVDASRSPEEVFEDIIGVIQKETGV